MRRLMVAALLVGSAGGAWAQGMRVVSPDGAVVVQVAEGPSRYSVSFHGKPVILDSALGLEFTGKAAGKTAGGKTHLVKRTWTPVWGKDAVIVDNYREGRMALDGLEVVVRAYDDGVAIRYVVPGKTGFVLTKDDTAFRFAGDPTVWAGTTKSFHHAYEQEFPKAKLSELAKGAHVVLPMLAEVQPDVYAAITEADLTDWAGMYLRPEQGGLGVDLSPRLDGHGLVVADGPRSSPWRVIMLGTTPGKLMESNLIENLNPPSKIKDTAWIKPGMMAWDNWWSGDVKMDNETIKRYIAFAGEMGWPYQLIDWQWYGPYNKPEAKISEPAKQLDWPGILAFAKEHHVREWLWIHSGDVTRAKDAGTLDAAFATYEGWGIAGVKIDFMDSNDQAMVRWYSDVVELAAKHHLMVDFHGAFVPTGLRVTWPNLLTREGVLGNEFNKFSTRVTPRHKLTLPFTRGLAGPMDYTPGGFLNRSPAEWKQTTPTQVMGSRAQELALFVVYWSPLTCVTDDPEHYRGQPGLDFLRVVPTIWDETRVLDGAVGENVVVARRSGERWFLGAMTGDKAYSVSVPLSFLGEGKFRVHLYADPADASASYESVVETTREVTRGEALTLTMRPAGGAALWIERI